MVATVGKAPFLVKISVNSNKTCYICSYTSPRTQNMNFISFMRMICEVDGEASFKATIPTEHGYQSFWCEIVHGPIEEEKYTVELNMLHLMKSRLGFGKALNPDHVEFQYFDC